MGSSHRPQPIVNGMGATEVAPPLLRTGQARCPVCRNTTRLTSRGYLRAHRDLFGHDCYNRAPEDAA